MKYVNWICLLTLGLALNTAFAGVKEGGGGTVVVLPGSGDDRVVLADYYYPQATQTTTSGRQVILPDDVKNELARVSLVLVGMDAKEDQSTDDSPEFRSEFVENSVLGTDINYLYVDQIPDYPECKNELQTTDLPAASQVEQVACTVGAVTYIKEDLFKQLSVRDQAILLVHEGLRRQEVPVAGEEIAKISNGLKVALDRLNRQLAGDRTALSQDETDKIWALFEAVHHAGLTADDPRENLSQYSVHPLGGGIVDSITDYYYVKNSFWASAYGPVYVPYRGQVADDAFIGIGVKVHPSRIESGAELVATNVCDQDLSGCEIKSHAQIINVRMRKTDQGYKGDPNRPGSQTYTLYQIGASASVTNSVLQARDLDLAPGSIVKDSSLQVAESWSNQIPFKWCGNETCKRGDAFEQQEDDNSKITLQSAARVESSQIKIANLTLQFNKDTQVKNIYLDSEYHHQGPVGDFKQTFIGSSVFAFDGKFETTDQAALCPNGKSHLSMAEFGSHTVDSMDDLKSYCAD